VPRYERSVEDSPATPSAHPDRSTA